MKKSMALVVVVSACGITLPTLAAQSLCAPTEKVFFSCRTSKKIVSVCASSDYPAPSAILQYRFGSKDKTEMSWPAPGISRAGMTFGNIAYSGGGLGYIRFATGDAGYVVYSGEAPGWDKEGVMVEKNGQEVANHRCSEVADQDLWHTGLPEESNDLENTTRDEIP